VRCAPARAGCVMCTPLGVVAQGRGWGDAAAEGEGYGEYSETEEGFDWSLRHDDLQERPALNATRARA
jgi:hypothetical protein